MGFPSSDAAETALLRKLTYLKVSTTQADAGCTAANYSSICTHHKDAFTGTSAISVPTSVSRGESSLWTSGL
jgi:hypothetical protein